MLIIATRSSPLALWQAEWVQAQLLAAGVQSTLLPLETQGDKIQDRTLAKIGSKGVFTQELEDCLLDGRAHLAVHSAKDMPSVLPAGLRILCFTERHQAHDVVVSYNPQFRLTPSTRCILGTSSTRRKALLARYYPQAQTLEARGNLQTRFRKLADGPYDALILAAAGVVRMGQAALIVQNLSSDTLTPPVGQGSLAIEIAENLPTDIQQILRATLAHTETEIRLSAERAFLAAMDGGCSIPTFGYAAIGPVGVTLLAGIVSLDGTQEVRVQQTALLPDAKELGRQVAERVLEMGGKQILDAIRLP